jgi:hypothetical protein
MYVVAEPRGVRRGNAKPKALATLARKLCCNRVMVIIIGFAVRLVRDQTGRGTVQIEVVERT